MKCHENSCNENAYVTVYWPGQVPPPVYCPLHAQKAANILRAMGTPVHVEPPWYESVEETEKKDDRNGK